ncbi:hypothetical protein [Acidobacterium sp. S8]|uniref:hypothetical protein n=1 Tax=Acidobacterium sp. S8 TaxID=1641854 RepID=UPI00131EBDA9|nr:hypothetical protein [Acidobacterium sp. S8]
MTYISAFRCLGGIVISADTEENWGDQKNYVEKLSIVEGLAFPLAIGGAGIADLVEPMVQEVTEKAAERKPATTKELAALLKEAIDTVYRDDLPWLAVKKHERTPEFLIAAKPTSEDFCIFRIKGRRLYPVKTMAIIGYATPINSALLIRMYRDNLPMQQAVMLAVYLVSLSKKLDEGVGGETSVAVIRENGAWIDYPPYILNSEDRIAEFLKLTDDLFLSSVDISISPSAFPAILEKFRNDVATLRQKYLDQSSAISLGRVFSDPNYGGEPYEKVFLGALVELRGDGGVSTREETPEERAQHKMMWEAAKLAINESAGKLLHHLLSGKQILYLGEEKVHVQGTAGLVEGSQAP